MSKIDFNASIVATTLLVGTLVPTISAANEIALTLKDQGITISGDFAGFQENAYIVETISGPIHVPAEIVTCEGTDCLAILSVNITDQ